MIEVKCDRCGKLYDKKGLGLCIVTQTLGENGELIRFTHEQKKYDLCFECRMEFGEFIRGAKIEFEEE